MCNHTSQEELEIFHALVFDGMTTNKTEIIKVNGCVNIVVNYKAKKILYFKVCFCPLHS